MKIYDVTVPISETVPIYKGDPAASVKNESSMARGEAANVTSL